MNHLVLFREFSDVDIKSSYTFKRILEQDEIQDEGWDWSYIIHTMVDISAMFADWTVTGSGAPIDACNALSYFVEAYYSDDEYDKWQLSLYGLVQVWAIMDPFGLITILKGRMNQVFKAILSKKPEAVISATSHATAVRKGFETLLEGLTGFIKKVLEWISQSKFGNVVAWLSKKLGITDVLQWLTKFLTQTMPEVIKKFLTILRDTFNPKMIGASGDEFSELVSKQIGKYAVSELHEKVAKTATDGIMWIKKNLEYPDVSGKWLDEVEVVAPAKTPDTSYPTHSTEYDLRNLDKFDRFDK